MAKKTTRDTRRIDKWLDIEKGTERDNPDSVRRFLFDLIAESYDRDTVKLAAAAAATIDRLPSKDRRRYHRKHDYEWYYQATRNAKIIHYGDLEVLARILGVPTALILLYTRLYSEFQSIERTKAEKARRMLEALRAAVDRAIFIISTHKDGDSTNSRLTFEDFEDIRRAYNDEINDMPLLNIKNS